MPPLELLSANLRGRRRDWRDRVMPHSAHRCGRDPGVTEVDSRDEQQIADRDPDRREPGDELLGAVVDQPLRGEQRNGRRDGRDQRLNERWEPADDVHDAMIAAWSASESL